MTNDSPGDADVLIVGGGPAGSTAAILLAEAGHRVVLIEKARHPRFHIGESLLPANLPLFERLGVAAQIRAMAMEKRGAEFVSPWHGRAETFQFAEAWNKTQPYAYQVRRSVFDEILIRRAAQQGATVIEGCRAQTVAFRNPPSGVRVVAEREDGTSVSLAARFLIDASGRDTLLANHFGIKRRNRKHSSAAIFGHFKGAKRHAGQRAGNISIYWFEHGWFWFIPLADGATSIGAVVWPYYLKSRKVAVSEFFLNTIQLCAPLAERLQGAALISAVEATGNYSYVADRCHGNHYLLLGDAYAFIDPVFSSGVWLAMNSAVAGAAVVDASLRDPQREPAATKHFAQVMRHGPRSFSWFIYRLTSPAMRELFMHPKNPLRMKEALLSVLAGDIFGRTPIWLSLMAFKAVYYATALLNLRSSLGAWRRRRHHLRQSHRDAAAQR